MIIYKRLKKPSAITFDLDDTLYNNWPIIRHAESELKDFLNREHPELLQHASSEAARVRAEVIDRDKRLASDMSRLRQSVLTQLASEVGYSNQQQKQVATRGYEIFYSARSSFEINKNIYSLLKELSELVPLVAITNGNVDLKMVGIEHLFSSVYQASIHYAAKPHPSMFTAALGGLKLPADRVLHVGDQLIKDVWGAHQCGMQTAWYAFNRDMRLQMESAKIIPSVVLEDLHELLALLD